MTLILLSFCFYSVSNRRPWSEDYGKERSPIQDYGGFQHCQPYTEALIIPNPESDCGRPKNNSSSIKMPFESVDQLRGTRKIVDENEESSSSHPFDLLSPGGAPTPPGTPATPEECSCGELVGGHNVHLNTFRRHSCHSLPASPALLRRTLVRMHSNKSDNLSETSPLSPRSLSPEHPSTLASSSPSMSLSPLPLEEDEKMEEEDEECQMDDATWKKKSDSLQVPSSLNGVERSPRLQCNRDSVLSGDTELVEDSFIVSTSPALLRDRRLSRESGFFSVGERGYDGNVGDPSNSWNDDPPKNDDQNHLDEASDWRIVPSEEKDVILYSEENEPSLTLGLTGRKRPSSYHSDDSGCCCGIASSLPSYLPFRGRVFPSDQGIVGSPANSSTMCSSWHSAKNDSDVPSVLPLSPQNKSVVVVENRESNHTNGNVKASVQSPSLKQTIVTNPLYGFPNSYESSQEPLERVTLSASATRESNTLSTASTLSSKSAKTSCTVITKAENCPLVVKGNHRIGSSGRNKKILKTMSGC